MMEAQAIAGEFIATFKDFPPRQRLQSFNLDEVMQRLHKPANDGQRRAEIGGTQVRAAAGL